MSWIDETWMRRAVEALKATLGDDALKRDMIQFLFDEGFWDAEKLKWDSAVARFNGCLNPNKEEYFKLGELWALMKRFGRHQFFLAMAADLGYEVRRIPSDERRQALMERVVEATEACTRAVDEARAEMARLDTADRSPRPLGTPDGRAHFSINADGTRPTV